MSKIKAYSLDESSFRRVWVIPDIHACAKTVEQLIDKVQPNESSDLLIFLGDYVNKGSKPIHTIQYLTQISISHRCVFLRGNHDQMVLDYWRTDSKTLKDQLIKLNSSDLLDKEDLFSPFFRNTIHLIESQKHLLVHAGFNFASADWKSDLNAILTQKYFEYDAEKTGGKTIIRGHFPVTSDEIQQSISAKSKVISLDNGCVYPERMGMGNLLAYDLKGESLIMQRNVENYT